MKYTLLFVLLLCLSGCGQRLPDGMPALHSCEITVTQDNKPLADALVILASSDETYAWIISGQTDTSGKAVMSTNGNFQGAPEGEFIVRVDKMELAEGHRLNPKDPYSAFSPSYEVHHVEKAYRESSSSPLKAKVESGKNQFTFDVGKAVEERMVIPDP